MVQWRVGSDRTLSSEGGEQETRFHFKVDPDDEQRNKNVAKRLVAEIPTGYEFRCTITEAPVQDGRLMDAMSSKQA